MLFFIFIILVLFIIFIVRLSKKTNESYGGHHYDADFDTDDIDDEMLFHQMMYDEGKDSFEDHSEEVFPDIYERNPEDMMFIDEDGEILDDI